MQHSSNFFKYKRFSLGRILIIATSVVFFILSVLTVAQAVSKVAVPAKKTGKAVTAQAKIPVNKPVQSFLSAQNLPLLRSNNLKYLGAFRVPATESNGSTFHYGGTAIGYNPDHDSLFIVGHDWYQKLSEVKVPQIVNSTKLVDLKTATTLQPFADVFDDKKKTVDSDSVKVGGTYVYHHKLYTTAYSYYDADNSQKISHLFSPFDLDRDNDARGVFQVGNIGARFVAGYMTDIPSVWQGLLGGPSLTGQCCLAIIGNTSSGPAAFVFDPNDLGLREPATATPLVYYPIDHATLGKWGETGNKYNGSTMMAGAVFPKSMRSVIFFGRQGVGTWCYGTGAECGDPVNSSKGGHAYPYQYQIWAYDARDLLKAKNKQVNPWDVMPYGVWTLDLPFATENRELGGVTYDAKKDRIFVSQKYGDGDMPVIHVFGVRPDIGF